MRKYPRIGNRHRRSCTRRDSGKRCDLCGAGLVPGRAMELVDIQVSWSRGDDFVAVLCEACSRLKVLPAHTLLKATRKED